MVDPEMPLLTEERIKRHEARDEWPDRTLVEYFEEAVDRYPTKPAIIDAREVSFTYEEMDALVDSVAAGLQERGVGVGDIVSVQLPNWSEWLVVQLAIIKIGAVINPLPPNLRTGDLEYIVGLVEPSVFVVPDEFHGHDYVEMVRDGVGYDGTVVAVAETPGDERADVAAEAYTALTETDAGEADFPGQDPNKLSVLPFTSGTTGNPKGCMMTQNTLNAAIRDYNERAGIDEDSVTFIPLTVEHQGGYGYGPYASVHAGGTCTMLPAAEWSGDAAIELMERHGVTHVFGPTPFLHDIVYADTLAERDTSSLDLFTCGGASISRTLLKDANERLDGTVVGSWGQTEDALATMTFPDDSDEKKIGTDGYPIGGMEVDTIDPDDEFPEGVGRLLVRGPYLMLGFYRRPEKTLDSMEGGADGWYVTGDLATIDDDGYISITGREKFVIMRGGEQIPVDKLEESLIKHEKINGVAVVAMPDDRLQERPCAYVEPIEGETFTFEEMIDYLDETKLTQQFYPERLELIDELPRSVSGNVKRHELREDVADKMGKDPAH
jgi:glutaryl-CoA dehydrogenase/cyclohexanecarboxylate-CoA ligase